ncbi:MAG: Gfo/Idh/MocA family oxidoreductase, partial [Armatimonadota bacterium]
SHAVDALRWWLGEPEAVYNAVRRMWSKHDDMFNALLTYANDAVGMLTANRASGTRYERVEVHARGVLCAIHAPHRAEIWLDNAREPTVVSGAELCGTDDQRVTYGFLGESLHFLQCVSRGEQPMPSFADAARTMQLCERLERGEL